jgi:hypothetical protein
VRIQRDRVYRLSRSYSRRNDKLPRHGYPTQFQKSLLRRRISIPSEKTGLSLASKKLAQRSYIRPDTRLIQHDLLRLHLHSILHKLIRWSQCPSESSNVGRYDSFSVRSGLAGTVAANNEGLPPFHIAIILLEERSRSLLCPTRWGVHERWDGERRCRSARAAKGGYIPS